jgi:hypothetical protein
MIPVISQWGRCYCTHDDVLFIFWDSHIIGRWEKMVFPMMFIKKWCLSAGKKLEGIISRHTIARSPWIYPWFRETWLGPLSQATTGKRKRTSMIFWVVIRCYKPKLPQIALLNLADLADLADWWVSWRYHSHIRGSIPTTDKLDSDLFPPFSITPKQKLV